MPKGAFSIWVGCQWCMPKCHYVMRPGWWYCITERMFWRYREVVNLCVCVRERERQRQRSLSRDFDEGGAEGRLSVSDFINEGGNVFIPGMDTPTSFLTNPSCCVCVCIWTGLLLSQIPSSVSLTGPSCRAASLFPPTGTTAQLMPPQPCQHSPCLQPTICSPDSDERRVGEWFSKKQSRKKERKKRCRPYFSFFFHSSSNAESWLSLCSSKDML